MRPTILVLVVLAIFFVALALAPATNARPQGWYLGLGGGWTTLGSVNYALAALAASQQSNVNFGDSREYGMFAGHRLSVPPRRWYVTSALSAPGPKLGTSALSHYISGPSGPPMLSRTSQLNRHFAQIFDFESFKPDDPVKHVEDSFVFPTRNAWVPCNRQATIDLGS
jgi:hypothetical protein